MLVSHYFEKLERIIDNVKLTMLYREYGCGCLLLYLEGNTGRLPHLI